MLTSSYFFKRPGEAGRVPGTDVWRNVVRPAAYMKSFVEDLFSNAQAAANPRKTRRMTKYIGSTANLIALTKIKLSFTAAQLPCFCTMSKRTPASEPVHAAKTRWRVASAAIAFGSTGGDLFGTAAIGRHSLRVRPFPLTGPMVRVRADSRRPMWMISQIVGMRLA